MLALQDENQILNYLDLEEKKRAIDESNVLNEKLSDKRIENGEDVSKDYAAACQELLQERSDLELKIEALLKSGEAGPFGEVLKTDVRASVAADKSSKNDTSPQKEPQPDDEQREHNDHNVNGSQKPRNEARSQPIEELSIHSQGDKTKSNKTSVFSKTSSVKCCLAKLE